jgi:Sulfotransferase domain
MQSRRALGQLLSPVRATVRRSKGMVPSYLVVGTKRGGSTSIAHWITEHPEVAPCRSNKGTHYFDVNYGRGWAWYLSRFPAPTSQRHTTGEASPYYMFHPLAPERIARAVPDVRLVVSLREPVARAWSHHQYETQQGFEDKPFPEAIALEETRLAGEEERLRREPAYESFAHRHHAYLRRGHYAEQLERLYQYFDPEQVLVLRSESMFTDPQGELDRVWAHLGLSPATLAGLDRLKATHRTLDIDEDLARALEDHYRPWNERLARLPGAGFSWSDNTIRGDA